MARTDLTEAQRRALAPHLPPDPAKGQAWSDHCNVINGILWRLRTGAAWRDIPERYGPRLRTWMIACTVAAKVRTRRLSR